MKREALLRGREELCHGLTRKSSHKGENNITVLNISKMTRPGSETWIWQSCTMPGLIAQDYDVKVSLLPNLLPNAFDVPSTCYCYEYCTITHHWKDWGTWISLVTDVNGGAGIVNCLMLSCFVHLMCIMRSMEIISLVKHLSQTEGSNTVFDLKFQKCGT